MSNAAVFKAIAAGRASGCINLSNKGLEQVPSAAYSLEEELPGVSAAPAKWWEVAEVQKLDLSHNQLKALPREIAAASTLQVLDVSHNQLVNLPEELGVLQELRALNLSNNRLLDCPESLAGLRALVSFSASSNQLTHLPEGLGAHQPALAVVAAQDNRLRVLPPGLSGASGLVRLEVAGNAITALPGFITVGLKSLTELDLSRNALSGVLGGEVGLLAKLRVLRLRQNRLTGLPPTIAGCTSLVELYCGANCLSSLPPELGLLSSLRTLELRDNQITAIPEEVCDLRLGLLDLANNDLRALPPALGLMTSLRSLPLEGNPLKSMRRELLAGPISSLLKHLQSKLPDPEASAHAPQHAARSGNIFGVDEASLAADMARKVALSSAASASAGDFSGGGGGGGSRGGSAGGGGVAGGACVGGSITTAGHQLLLAGTGLRDVPQDVWLAGPALVKLDLSNNPLGNIDPSALAQLCGLTALCLNALPGMTRWPLPLPPLGQPVAGSGWVLRGLRELQLCHASGLRDALPPGAFACCPNLTRLEMSATPAACLLAPGALAVLHSSLEVLDLSRTGCGVLPGDVLALTRLRLLNLSNNRIAVLPDAITALNRLEELNLTNNDLASLPPALGLMAPTLRALGLEGNPLRTIRRPILERGTPALLQYLKDRIPA